MIPVGVETVMRGLVLICLCSLPAGVWAAEEPKDHWAWTAPKQRPLPTVKNRAWVQDPIDRFILQKLETAGVQPAPAASREQLIRRVTFDLIGLPPTPEEIDAFVRDTSPKAWEKVIDRLLASPHHGERWGRHWLDLARFAESNGYEFDEARPDAWRYRDYVIQSLNANKPYDRFVREQLAGDELFPDDPQALVATGFNLLGPDMTDSSDQARRRQNTLNDMTDTAGLVFLGLTLGCARCHDHKFEPIPQADYYRLQAFFAPAVFRKDLPVMNKDQRPAMETAMKEFSARLQPLQEEAAKLEEPYRIKLRDAKLAPLPPDVQQAHRTSADRRTPAQQELVARTARQVGVSKQAVTQAMSPADRARHQELEAQIKKLEQKKPPIPLAMGMQETGGTAPKTFLLERGELGNAAEEVHPGFPVVLLPEHKPIDAAITSPGPKTSGRRASLAAWITKRDNPLSGRVMVNRLWQYHFGRGIVASTSDFGLRGERPTHPELLDWLALQFIEDGWDIKAMHKRMLLSSTYQQATTPSREARERDPENRLFSRMNRLRLEGEIVRDSLLAVSGRLNRKMGGPSVFPAIPPEAGRGSKGGWSVSTDAQDHVRRSVYIFVRRNLRFPWLQAFDLPDSNQSCPKRERSTTAPQALALMNAPEVGEAARALAERVQKEATTDDARVLAVYRLALGRKPTATEARIAHDFLQHSPMTELCRALFNVNEFVYLD
jgi:hypothetical protein